jgi:site-specific DNA-methyltransferase (adenine-specific)
MSNEMAIESEVLFAHLNRIERQNAEILTLLQGKKTGPTIKKGRSNQSVETPDWLVDACRDRFGDIVVDLAASKSNTKCERFFDEEQNSLVQDWTEVLGGDVGWLNSPFDPAKPWAEKCRIETMRGAKIIYLCQASVGSKWFRENIQGRALILTIPRIKFVGEQQTFMKDLVLACFNLGEPKTEHWDVKEPAEELEAAAE